MVSYRNLFSCTFEKTTQGIILLSLKGTSISRKTKKVQRFRLPKGPMSHFVLSKRLSPPSHLTLGGYRGGLFPWLSPLNPKAHGPTSRQWGDTLIWGFNKWPFSGQTGNFSFLLWILHTTLSLLYQEAISPICLGR